MNRFVSLPWLVMALIFLLGIGSGVLLTIGLGPRFSTPPGAQEMRNRWMMRLTHRLNLTDDQQAKIQPIVADAETQIQAVHHEDVGRVSGILQAATTKISALLNPDQQAELGKMERERERMFQGRMHGPGMHDMGGPGGGPPPPAAP
jgi:hypothetical protein